MPGTENGNFFSRVFRRKESVVKAPKKSEQELLEELRNDADLKLEAYMQKRDLASKHVAVREMSENGDITPVQADMLRAKIGK